MDKWYKMETSNNLNPCVCGCNRRAYFKNGDTIYIKCVKCLLTVSGKSEEKAEAEWNKTTKGVNKVNEGRKAETGGEVKKSSRRSKKSVSGESVS